MKIKKNNENPGTNYTREVIATLKEGLPSEKKEFAVIIIPAIALLAVGLALYPESSFAEIAQTTAIVFTMAIAAFTITKIITRTGSIARKNMSPELLRRLDEGFGRDRVMKLTRQYIDDIALIPSSDHFFEENTENETPHENNSPKRKHKIHPDSLDNDASAEKPDISRLDVTASNSQTPHTKDVDQLIQHLEDTNR